MKRTTTEAELRKWNDEGLTRKEVAEILGFNKTLIFATYAVLGISSPGRQDIYGHIEPALLAISQGVRLADYCKPHGIYAASLHTALRKAGHPTTAGEYLRRKAGGV